MNNYHNNQTMHFEDITLIVNNLETSLDFYHGILGFKYQIEDRKAILFVDEKPLVKLIEDPNAKKDVDVYGLYHVAFLLPSRAALANTINQLIRHQYPTSGLTDHGVSIAIYLNDPDGNGIEIYVDKDESLWPRENGKISMFTKGYPIADIMKHLNTDSAYQINQKTVIGHLHFYVPSLDEAKDFFVDLLGFKETQLFMNSALFISDQGYHHHLGLNTWLRHSRNRKAHEPGLKAYTLFVPKHQYDQLLEKLKTKNLDVDQLIDPLGQSIKIMTEK
ncbi:hypothetical protein BK010_01590 [Tenericutes bacterium MO-XQ]|nr:hypothetical protein BK010_01590 [Tenericutes bacterium MO-XQ]